MFRTTPYRTSRAAPLVLLALLLAAPLAAHAQTATNLQTMFANFASSASALITLVQKLAEVTGLAVMVVGVVRMAAVVNQGGGNHGWAYPGLTFLAGVLLFSTPAFLTVVTNTLGIGGGLTLTLPVNILGTSMGTGNAAGMQAALDGVVLLIQLLGNIAFFRGLYIIKMMAEGRGDHGWFGVMTWIGLGVIAIHVTSVAGIFGATVAPGFHLGL